MIACQVTSLLSSRNCSVHCFWPFLTSCALSSTPLSMPVKPTVPCCVLCCAPCCSGIGAPWHLEHVEILHQATGERYYFVADQWLEKKRGTSIIFLEPTNAAGAKQMYKVRGRAGRV